MSPDAAGNFKGIYIRSEIPWHSQCFLYERGGCQGHLERHHLIAKQRLKRHFKSTRTDLTTGEREDLIWSHKILVSICAQHHAQVTNARIYITRSELPESVFDYAKEHGLDWCLDREYPEEGK